MKRRASAEVGATVVEIMVACLILVVMVMAGGAYLTSTRAQIGNQRNRQAALYAANSRLEDIRAAAYAAVSPLALDYSTNFLSKPGGVWRVTAGNPGETVSVGGRPMPMTTTVRYQDVDGGTPSYDCLVVTVAVGYRRGPETVSLETVKSP